MSSTIVQTDINSNRDVSNLFCISDQRGPEKFVRFLIKMNLIKDFDEIIIFYIDTDH
jgi:uncharacterized protein YrzB (UPF0473 family)